MTRATETRLRHGVLVVPQTAVASALVLTGSSGRADVARARLLAAHGVAALALQYFGGPHQPPGICEIPLETFAGALERLAKLSSRVAVIGLSKGAEAALLLAARDPRIALVCAIAPSSVVWANVGPGTDGADRPLRSSWTRQGEPLPFVPYDDAWVPDLHDGSPRYRGLYEQSLRTYASRVADATIPVERIAGDVLLVAGGDDQVWPSDLFAEQIRERRDQHGLPTTVLTSPGAGHRIPFPGEPTPAGGLAMARGGSDAEDRALGERAWTALTDALGV